MAPIRLSCVFDVAQLVSVLFAYSLLRNQILKITQKFIDQFMSSVFLIFFWYRLHKVEVKFNGKACMLG